jgi:hypothetical protein
MRERETTMTTTTGYDYTVTRDGPELPEQMLLEWCAEYLVSI